MSQVSFETLLRNYIYDLENLYVIFKVAYKTSN